MIKKIMPYLLVGSLLFSMMLISCKDDNTDIGSTLIVNKFYPTKGGVGTEILITGKNFTSDTSQVSVSVDGKPLKVIACNETGIMVVVPKKLGSGPLEIKVGDRETVSVEKFTYTFSAIVTTLAGNRESGYADGEGATAQFALYDSDQPWKKGSICVDNNLNVYVGDVANQCIRKITPDGMVSTLAGRPGSSGHVDGTGLAARFQAFYGMDCDAEGNIYVTDVFQSTIRKVTPEGVVTTILDPAPVGPWCLAVDKRNGTIYVGNCENNGIFQLQQNGSVTRIVPSTSIAGLTVDKNGNLFAVEYGTNSIVKYTVDTWEKTLITGSGNGYVNGSFASAMFSFPWGIDVDTNGDIYVAGNDGGVNLDQSIRIVDMGREEVRTVAGSPVSGYVNANGSAAAFHSPLDVAVDKNGVIYVYDRQNNVIRKIVYE